MIKTLIYIGKNVYGRQEPSEENPSGDEWYFQDPQSYLEHGSFLKLSKESRSQIEYEPFIVTKDAFFPMYHLKGLIERLGKIKCLE